MPDGNANEQMCGGLAKSENPDSTAHWHVLWTRSNCERTVYEQLTKQGYDAFLPTTNKWSRSKRAQRIYRAPLFPGYLFVRHAIDKFSYLEISKARGLVRILGERWDNLAAVPDSQIEGIIKVEEADLPRMPYTYLKKGEAVRIMSGPLANVEGIFVKSDESRGLLVLSVEMLAQSVAVEVDRSQVVPVQRR